MLNEARHMPNKAHCVPNEAQDMPNVVGGDRVRTFSDGSTHQVEAQVDKPWALLDETP